MSQISVRNVSKSWGATPAVDNVSFEAGAASLVVLLGPSGCGKSTTLRLIAGLEQVSGGRIFIGGNDVTALPPAQRRIALVFQSYALFPHLTVKENILFGLRVRKCEQIWSENFAAQSDYQIEPEGWTTSKDNPCGYASLQNRSLRMPSSTAIELQ